MSRSYRGIRAKKHRVYSGEDLQRLYDVSKNTISNWVGAGLKPVDEKRPYLFRGATVNAFHMARRARSAHQLRRGEFYCTSCKAAVVAERVCHWGKTPKNDTRFLQGRCSECRGHVRRFVAEADVQFYLRISDPNTTGDQRHEAKFEVPGGIGTCPDIDTADVWCVNDRILYSWQIFAGRYDDKTIDRHLAAIRKFEIFLRGKRFEQLTVEDVGRVRDELKSALAARDENKRSKSTIAHVASHIGAFLDWLIKQDGFKRLPRDLPEYLKLPKSAYAEAIGSGRRQYMSLPEAEQLLCSMPGGSLLELRNRAIFAIAFLGALRADTLISLRIRHVDTDKRLIIQDASEVRAKNGKSLRIAWFPIPDCFAKEVKRWIGEQRCRGFRDDDALFPSAASLELSVSALQRARPPIATMVTRHAVAEAFASACSNSNIKYSPHSARHTIASERDNRPLTQQQRRAWSENMGHENEQITERHYAHIPEDRRFELLSGADSGYRLALLNLSDQDKVKLFDSMIDTLDQRAS